MEPASDKVETHTNEAPALALAEVAAQPLKTRKAPCCSLSGKPGHTKRGCASKETPVNTVVYDATHNDSSESLNAALRKVLQLIHTSPKLLYEDHPEVKKKLRSQGRKGTQGTGNQVTDQEAAFAAVLESAGFVFINKADIKKQSHGLYYIYQKNGTQQSLDFQVLEISESGEKTAFWNLDLKHTTEETIHLNDGWFRSGVIYIFTWNRKTSAFRQKITREVETFVGFGQDIPSDDESVYMKALQEMKARLKSENKKIGRLSTFLRFANKYVCDFEPSFVEERYNRVIESLSHSSSSSDSSSPPSEA